LSDPNIDPSKKLAIVIEIRDSIEVVHSGEYSKFLMAVLPSFIFLLNTISVNILVDSNENVNEKLTRN
jgi:hypothetical protein